MPITEFPPDLSHLPEAAAQNQHPRVDEHIGDIALQGEVGSSTPDVIDDAYIDAGTEIAAAQANGVDARMEDVGRVHDVGEAYHSAMAEEVERAHAEALIENEIFDVYDQAVKENEE